MCAGFGTVGLRVGAGSAASAMARSTAKRSDVPDQVQGLRADHRAAVEGRRLLRVEAELRKAGQQLLVEDLQLDSGQVRTQAAVRAGAEGDVHRVAVQIVGVRL